MTGIHLLVVSGSPGIGKSYFLYFVMHNLAMMDPKPTVVLQIRQNPVYCFNNDTVTVTRLVRSNHFKPLLTSPI